jgi:hypothetical protein
MTASKPSRPAARSAERGALIARRGYLENQRRVFARKWFSGEPGWDEEFYEEMDASAARALASVQADLDALDAEPGALWERS